MGHETQPLTDIIIRIVDKRRSERRISPSWVATEAMLEIDPAEAAPLLVRLGCHLELRQIARQVLRTFFEDGGSGFDDEADGMHDLFPDLQWRYPQAHVNPKDEPVYVRLEDLTPDDLAYNIVRLRREGRAKLAHADALQRYQDLHRSRVSP
jgi:hypothetical protein